MGNLDHVELAALHLRIGKEHPHTANRVVELVSSVYGYAASPAVRLYAGENPAKGIEGFLNRRAKPGS